MQTSTETQVLLPTRTQWLVKWAQSLFFGIAILALGYCVLTLLNARIYQASAMRSLQDQIHTQAEGKLRFPEAAPKEGDVLGRMDIPRLGMSVAVLQGTNSRILRLGAGHIAGTALPGNPGNSGIAGHRDTFFRALKGIQQFDEIRVQTATGLFHYQVDWVKVVSPDDVSVLAPSAGSTLTLVTCYPFQFIGAAPKRLVVHAQMQ